MAMLALLLLGLNALVAPTFAQAETSITAEALQAKLKEIEAAEGMDQALKDKHVELYRQALRHLESIRAKSTAAQAFEKARGSAPAETARLRKELQRTEATTVTPETLNVSEKSSLADLEQRLVKEKADLAALESKLADVEEQLRENKTRPKEIRERLAQLKRGQEDTAAASQAPPAAGEAPSLTEARQLMLELQRRAQGAEIRMLNQELLSQPSGVALLRAQWETATRAVARTSERVHLLEDLVNQSRLSEAEKAQAVAAEAERQAAGKHPAIRRLAARNAELTRKLASLVGDLERVTAEREHLEKQAKQIEENANRARQGLAIAGLSEALGEILSDRRRKLPDLRKFEKDMAERKERIAQVALAELRIEEESEELADLPSAVNVAMTEVLASKKTDSRLSDTETDQIRAEVTELLRDRRMLLNQAATTYGTYLQELTDLGFAQDQLLKSAESYAAFLDEHLLWTPNQKPMGLGTLHNIPLAVGWLVSPRNWLELPQALVADGPLSFLIIALALLVFVALLRARKPIRAALDANVKKVGKLSTDTIGLTIKALALTLLLAVNWPILLAVLGWRLQASAASPDFAKAVGEAFVTIAPLVLNIRAFHLFCRQGGVADIHFHWSEPTLKLLRRQLNLLLVVGIPAAFVAKTAANATEIAYGSSLRRAAFLIIMIVLAVFFRRILNPNRGVTHRLIKEHPAGWLSRLRYLWYPLAISTPIALAVLAALGYYSTAAELTQRLVNTLWLVFGAIIVHDLIIRWLVLTRRKLAIQQAREKRLAVRAAQEVGDQPAGETMPAPEEPELDLASVDMQTRKLLHIVIVLSAAVGLWLIWADKLPALGILDDPNFSLWQHAMTVDGKEVLAPITLADLLLAVALGLLAAAAAKNLPAVLEIAILQRVSLESGTRYAVKALTQYTIVVVGIIVVFNTIGGSWSQIQWLVAALSVGLGFGLQEIVANFVSGIIILFERPIRVGDIVTVGDTTGIVSRMHIRATTITNWDKQELLVPNKEFITGRLLNWSLSDQMNRIVITIGIAYGSDVEKALELMAEAADEHERVLKDPKPIVTFEGFGDNALTLLLRCYLDSLEFRLATISELHQAINGKFNQAGIVIAFPQRDLHLDASRPLDIRIHRANASPPHKR
jgi:potassium efflux system protein